MFANEDEGFQELFDRLLAYSSTKQSVRMSEIKRQSRRDDPKEVDALSKGKGKGKKGSSGFGKGKVKTARGMLCVGTVASLATMRKTVNRSGHRIKNGQERKTRAKVRAKARAS